MQSGQAILLLLIFYFLFLSLSLWYHFILIFTLKLYRFLFSQLLRAFSSSMFDLHTLLRSPYRCQNGYMKLSKILDLMKTHEVFMETWILLPRSTPTTEPLQLVSVPPIYHLISAPSTSPSRIASLVNQYP